MPSKAEVLAFAAKHGPSATARHFGIAKGTVTGWQARERQRQAKRDRPSPAQRFEQAARELLDRATAGRCLRCDGRGFLAMAQPGRRYAYRIVCPDCGRPARRPVVVGTNLRMELAIAADRHAQVARREDLGDVGHPEAWQ